MADQEAARINQKVCINQNSYHGTSPVPAGGADHQDVQQQELRQTHATSYQLSTRIILAELQLPTNTRRLRLSVDTATASPVAAIGAATSANHAASSADHARDARKGQQHVGGAQVAAARGHAAEAPTASSVRTLASWELGDREGQGEAVFVVVAGAQVDGPWRRHRAGPASAERNELEAWRVGDEPTIERGRRGPLV